MALYPALMQASVNLILKKKDIGAAKIWILTDLFLINVDAKILAKLSHIVCKILYQLLFHRSKLDLLREGNDLKKIYFHSLIKSLHTNTLVLGHTQKVWSIIRILIL